MTDELRSLGLSTIISGMFWFTVQYIHSTSTLLMSSTSLSVINWLQTTFEFALTKWPGSQHLAPSCGLGVLESYRGGSGYISLSDTTRSISDRFLSHSALSQLRSGRLRSSLLNTLKTDGCWWRIEKNFIYWLKLCKPCFWLVDSEWLSLWLVDKLRCDIIE